MESANTPVINDLEQQPLRTELMVGERYDNSDSYSNHQADLDRYNNDGGGHSICQQCLCASFCLGYPLIDNSEPCFWIMFLLGLAGIIYAGFETWWFFLLFSTIAVVVSFIAGWRVRKLGVAKQLMESVTNLKEQNEVLINEVEELNTNNRILKNELVHFSRLNEKYTQENRVLAHENQKFLKLNGLLKDNVIDIKTTKDQLFALIERYEKENEKFEANNLMHLFFIVDRDNSSFLTTEECSQMNVYVKNIYDIDMNLDKLDKDKDQKITITEFVNGLRNKMNAKKISNQDSFKEITL